jgi:MinD superfamily P-loop ATPase
MIISVASGKGGIIKSMIKQILGDAQADVIDLPQRCWG